MKKTIEHKDTSAYDPLYQEVMGQCLDIQTVLTKHDLLFEETPFEEWKELRQRFWNQYVYPKFEGVYFELFPDERVKRDDPDYKRNMNILEYNQKMVIALCEWLKREGFFHFFEGEYYFINPDPTDLAFILTDGVPFKRYPPHYIGTLLERVTKQTIEQRKKNEKLSAWLIGLSIALGLLVFVLILIISG